MPTLKLIRGKYLMVLIAMCGLIASSLGILTNCAGIFFTPIAAEMHQETAAVNLTLTISNLVFAAAGMAAARLLNAKNFRITIIASSVVFVGGTAALSLCRSMAPLYALNALRGFAAGVIGNVLGTMTIGYWFRTDTGFISSLAFGCSGIVGALFNPILEGIINSAGWRTAYLAAAGIILVLNLPAMVLPIRLRPEDAGLAPLAAESAGKEKEARPARTGNSRSPLVLLLAVAAVSMASLIPAVPQLVKSFAATYGMAETGVIMMTVCLIANTGGKFLCGVLTDRLGVRRTVTIYISVIAAGVCLLLLVHEPAAMLAGAACIGLSYSIPTVCAVMICRELFSPERYKQVFPVINLGGTVANAAGYPLLGAIYDASGSYDGALILILAVAAATVAEVLLVYRLAAKESRAA